MADNKFRFSNIPGRLAEESDLKNGNFMAVDCGDGTHPLPAELFPLVKIIDRGEATVATLNALTFKQDGWKYFVTDSGTLSAGSLVVSAGDSVAWDAANSVWSKVNQYGPKSVQDKIKVSLAEEFKDSIKYVAGNTINKEGENYTFFADHPAGAWNGNDVDKTNLSENMPAMNLCGFETNVINANNVAGKTISYDITNCPLTRGFMGYTGTLVKQNNTAFTRFPLYGVKKIKVYAATFAGSSSIAYLVVTNKAGDQILGLILSTITQDKEIYFDLPTEGIVYFNLLSKNFANDVSRKFDVTYFSETEIKLFEEKFPVQNKLEFSRNGYTKSDTGVNVADNTNNWFNTDFKRTDGIIGLKYTLRTNSAAASIAFYDSSRAYMQASSVIYASGAEHSGVVTIPTGAKYYVVCSALQSLPSSYVIEMKELANEIKKITPITTCQKNKKCLNIIGDSISEGVSCETDYADSWAGILRNLVAIENGGALNYGFASYPDLDELGITNSMVKPLGRGGWSRNYAGTALYGNNEFTATASSTMKFSLAKEMHYMQVSFLGGSTQGAFSVLRRDPQNNDTLLATIDCSQYADGCHKSDPIDISSVTLADTIRITSADATPVTISGFFFSDDSDYFMFNNFGRAGLQPVHTEGNLLALESDCDVLIYALGVNGNAAENESAYETIAPTLKACNAVKFVLDFCLFSPSRDNRSKSCDIKAFAEEIGAEYIRMYDELPRDSDGHTIADLLKSDGLHPNDAGHKYIAEVVAKKLGLSISSKAISLSGKLDGGWI